MKKAFFSLMDALQKRLQLMGVIDREDSLIHDRPYSGHAGR